MQLPMKTGQVIEVGLFFQGREVSCEAVVLAIEERSFLISPPRRKGVLIPVEMDQLALTINNADAIHLMLCRVEALDENGVSLAFPAPETVQRLQRRRFVRVTASLDCRIETEGEVEGRFGTAVKARILDISGGGCSVLLSPTVPRGAFVRLCFELPEEGEVVLTGRVIRSTRVRLDQGAGCQLCVEFQHISEFTRSKVIRFVFGLQRLLAWRAGKNTSPLN